MNPSPLVEKLPKILFYSQLGIAAAHCRSSLSARANFASWRFYFGDPPHVALFVRKLPLQKRFHRVFRQLNANGRENRVPARSYRHAPRPGVQNRCRDKPPARMPIQLVGRHVAPTPLPQISTPRSALPSTRRGYGFRKVRIIHGFSLNAPTSRTWWPSNRRNIALRIFSANPA